jgi:hypothetical protein
MAKIFISYPKELSNFTKTILDFLRKNSGHRLALYQQQSDFTIEFIRDWAGGEDSLDMFVFNDEKIVNELGKHIINNFKLNQIKSNYPKKKKDLKEFNTLQIRVGRENQNIDFEFWSNLIAESIVSYFNPEYISAGKKEKEPLRKKPQDKTYYDRTFNNNATSNSSLIFKKGAK